MNQSWSYMKNRYTESVEGGLDIKFMVDLIEDIESSPYKLNGWTSMHDLCISQTTVEHPHYFPYLRISPLFNGKVEFRYIDTHVTNRQCSREEDTDKLFERLEWFIEQLHWQVKVENNDERHCPKCFSDKIIPIVYGKPSPEGRKKIEQGQLKLGGCMLIIGSPNRYCKACDHKWVDENCPDFIERERLLDKLSK